MESSGLTLDELLANLNRELVRTWGDPAAAAEGVLGGEPAVHPGGPAGRFPDGAPGPAGERCLVATVGGRRLALPARAVTAVTELPPVAAVPFSPSWLRGLTRVANGVVAVVDLARRLAPEPPPAAPADAAPEPDDGACETLIVVRTADAALDAGLVLRGIARLVVLAGLPGRPPRPGPRDARLAALVPGLLPQPRRRRARRAGRAARGDRAAGGERDRVRPPCARHRQPARGGRPGRPGGLPPGGRRARRHGRAAAARAGAGSRRPVAARRAAPRPPHLQGRRGGRRLRSSGGPLPSPRRPRRGDAARAAVAAAAHAPAGQRGRCAVRGSGGDGDPGPGRAAGGGRPAGLLAGGHRQAGLAAAARERGPRPDRDGGGVAPAGRPRRPPPLA